MQKCNSTHPTEQQHEGKDLCIEDIRRFLNCNRFRQVDRWENLKSM